MIKISLSSLLGDRRWTQKDLARKTGIRANTINLLYHEIADRVTFEHLNLICKVLNCRHDELMEYIPDPESDEQDVCQNAPDKK